MRLYLLAFRKEARIRAEHFDEGMDLRLGGLFQFD